MDWENFLKRGHPDTEAAKLAESTAYAIKRKNETGQNYFVDSNFCVLWDEPFNRKQAKRYMTGILFTTKGSC